MARDVVDDRFIGALHVLALTRKGLAHDTHTEHAAIQAGTINALLKGCYEGDITMADLLRLGTDGIGTVQNLDGELIVLHGVAYSARADGSVVVVGPDTKTPFAVLTRFDSTSFSQVDALPFKDFLAHLDRIAPIAPVVAIRASGSFQNLHLRIKPNGILTRQRAILLGFAFPTHWLGWKCRDGICIFYPKIASMGAM